MSWDLVVDGQGYLGSSGEARSRQATQAGRPGSVGVWQTKKRVCVWATEELSLQRLTGSLGTDGPGETPTQGASVSTIVWPRPVGAVSQLAWASENPQRPSGTTVAPRCPSWSDLGDLAEVFVPHLWGHLTTWAPRPRLDSTPASALR